MAQDFSFEPFFDDYSEDKGFHRILFRPGYAVQARELTQLQTILQEQIKRHGDHIFKEGSMVIPGQISYDNELDYVQLESTADVDLSMVLQNLVDKDIQNTNGLIAKVIAFTKAENVNGIFEPNTIFVKYQNSIVINRQNVSVFAPGDILNPVDGSANLTVRVAPTRPISNIPITGIGSSATILRGVYYISKNFVLVKDQTIILDKYTNTPNYRVGLQLVEEIVLPENDESLLDNALGSPNFAAPGAARYKMDLILTKIPEDSDQISENPVEEGFIDLLRLRAGKVVFKINRATYAEIEKTLARRTFDESGDYSLSQFGIQVKNFRNNFRGPWAANEIYIQGDIIEVPINARGETIYVVAVTSGSTGTTQPIWANYKAVDNFVDNSVVWEYSLTPAFNGGVYTLTSGDSTFENFTANDHQRLDAYVVYAVEPGKAYVRGREIEKISTEYLIADKSRFLPAGSNALADYLGVQSGTLLETVDAFSPSKTTSIDLTMGAYINVNSVIHVPDLLNLPVYQLHNTVRTTSTTSTIIGTARIRALERVTTTDYRLFLFDIKMNTGRVFKDVKSVSLSPNSTAAFACNSIQVDNATTLRNLDGSNTTGLLWQMPAFAIAQISEVSYSVVVPITATSVGTTATFVAPTGYTFESIADNDNYIVINNATGAHVNNPSLAIVSGNLQVSGLVASTSYTVLATTRRSDVIDAQARRSLTDATPIELKLQEQAQQREITLNHSYVVRIVSIMMAAGKPFGNAVLQPTDYNVDITSNYNLIEQQDQNGIYLGRLRLVGALPTAPIRIKYEYMASVEGSPGDFLGVGSYTHNDARIRYEDIRKVGDLSLRDCIDFRPYQVSNGLFQPRYFPKVGSTGSFKFRNFLPRYDTVALDSSGRFVVTRGIPAEFPIPIETTSEAMKLATVAVGPYTFGSSDQLDVAVDRIENKRYTMRDIGRLERRIQDLEYYTSLTLTELDTKNLRIIDADGFERFQNGFLVDTFDGQGIGNTSSDDWNCSIDIQNKELRPFFYQKHTALVEDRNSSFATVPVNSRYRISGDLVTLPYTEKPLIVQNKAAITENINPFAIYTFKGTVDVNPWSDTWFATEYRPDIIINDNSQYEAVVRKAQADGILGTVWNSWQTVFASTRTIGTRTQAIRNGFFAGEFGFARDVVIETQATNTTQVRTGTRTFIAEDVNVRVVEDRVVETRMVPFIRPKTVLFTGFGFKPNTRMFSFFDNINVDKFITPAVRLEVIPVTSGTLTYPINFNINNNVGSNVSSNIARKMYYSNGVPIDGTVTLTLNSATVTGSGTLFTQDVEVNDFLSFDGVRRYRVLSIQSDTSLTLTEPWTAPTVSGVSATVIGINTTNEVELAFNRGEVITEVGGNGNTAVVVGQEISDGKFFVYVLNIRGTGNFSTSASAYLEGEFVDPTTNLKPRVRFVARTNFTDLTTTGTGLLCGLFRIPSTPSLKFRVGRRELQFSNSSAPSSSQRTTLQSTSGSAFYEARGVIDYKQRTILATRTAQIVQQQVSETNTLVNTGDRIVSDTGWYDPLAQTFLVQEDGGAFITSVDLFFATKDQRIPVRVEIREVINGYPSATIVPFSVAELTPARVNVDPLKGLKPTRFTFQAPVYLENGVEYAIVVLSDSNGYKAWVSEAGNIDVATNTLIVSQPYNGVLFKSQNGSTWTPNQNQDLKFTLNRAEFSTSPTSIEFKAPEISLKLLGIDPFYFVQGSRRCRVTHPNHGMIPGEKVLFRQRMATPRPINGIAANSIFNVQHTIISAELDSYVIEFPGLLNATATGNFGGVGISATENFEFTTGMLEMTSITPSGSSVSYQLKCVDHADQITTIPVTAKDNFSFDSVKVYPSEVNYNNPAFPSGLSIIATLNPGRVRSVSPVIDLGRMGLTLVCNKIDNPDLTISDPALDNVSIVTNVQMEDGQNLNLLDDNGDTAFDTIFVAAANPAYDNFNRLNAGDVIRVTYTEVTNATRNVVITSKSIDASNNLYFGYEVFQGSDPLTKTSGTQRISIVWLSRFKSEFTALGSSTHSKYVTKKINFSRPSEMIKIMFDAIIPNDAEVEIYYKTAVASQSNSNFIEGRYFKATPQSYLKNENEFTAVVADIQQLAPFDSIVVKLVMKSINKAKAPRIKNFRVICAA